MIATTNQSEQVANLSACAISLLQREVRNHSQTQPVFDALTKYTGQEKILISVTKRTYPGRDANRCLGCGGWIDDGGHCYGGTDHWKKEPGACAKTTQTVTLSHKEQLAAIIRLTAKAIDLSSSPLNTGETQQLIKTLQSYKEARRIG